MDKQLNGQDAIEKFLLRINKDVKAKAEAEAKKDNRSLNGHIINLVETDLRQRGVIE